ncbi:hypothetical protein GCM10009665_68290 [Kitasatospora nipponensis]|uniref:OmpR/PhoB-type domain-containing protein n=1 Tax=Kitasatospora nipponensis TaxID=258049 RepID=A0ABP4HN39_9ACTN
MSSSSATLNPPAATPHLRAVRAVSSTSAAAERRYAAAPFAPLPPSLPPIGPAPVQSPPLQAVPAPDAQPALAPGLLGALPQGATVVAALPQSALPQALLAQYGAQLEAQHGAQPLVGYLVLVPAEAAGVAAQPVAPAPVFTAPGGSERPAPHRGAGRGISVDPERRTAYVDGRQLDLTYLEFELLAHLTQHPQRVHSRDYLVSAVWGYGHVGDGRTVDVHVARLRRKLGAVHRDSIVTVRRVGYKYAPSSRA